LPSCNNIPICATLLGKSVVSERHPLYLGVYEGAMGREEVRKYVEDSDCMILLGAFMSDINLGGFTARLDPGKCIYATSEKLRIRHHHFHDVQFADFMNAISRQKAGDETWRAPKSSSRKMLPWKPSPAPVTDDNEAVVSEDQFRAG
jgi:indolepyruvate decarboxylase